jgi:hypothetical protein
MEQQMRPQRSRIGRIYRHLTRRTPNRRAQWQQVVQLRPHGSLGNPMGNSMTTRPRRARASGNESRWVGPETGELNATDWLPVAPSEGANPVRLRQDGRGGLAAVLSTSLFLMGCGYAAFAGYLLSIRPAAAYCAVAASIISLLVAGIGISLAASERYRRESSRLLGVSLILLAAFYGVLIAAVV